MSRRYLGVASTQANQLITRGEVATLIASTSGSNANGKYLKRADGQIEQTGEVTLSGGTATITFPVAFPTVCDFVDLTAVLTSATATDCSVYQTAEAGTASVAIGGTTTTVGVGATVAAASFKVRWRAVGS